MSWDSLGITVYAHLATSSKPALCTNSLAILSFSTLQIHVLVSGECAYAWAPLATIAPAPTQQSLDEVPIGRLLFSQSTGMKLMMKYGTVTENLSLPVPGDIEPEYHGLLAQLGRRSCESTYEIKEEIVARVELEEDRRGFKKRMHGAGEWKP